MTSLANWLLLPAASQRLSVRYHTYRRNGAPPFSAALGCLWFILAWTLLPLENANWTRLRKQQTQLYPHINPLRPRPLDAVRYTLQSL